MTTKRVNIATKSKLDLFILYAIQTGRQSFMLEEFVLISFQVTLGLRLRNNAYEIELKDAPIFLD